MVLLDIRVADFFSFGALTNTIFIVTGFLVTWFKVGKVIGTYEQRVITLENDKRQNKMDHDEWKTIIEKDMQSQNDHVMKSLEVVGESMRKVSENQVRLTEMFAGIDKRVTRIENKEDNKHIS